MLKFSFFLFDFLYPKYDFLKAKNNQNENIALGKLCILYTVHCIYSDNLSFFPLIIFTPLNCLNSKVHVER